MPAATMSSIPCVICGTFAWDPNDRYCASKQTSEEIRASHKWCYSGALRAAVKQGDVQVFTLGEVRESSEDFNDAHPAELEGFALAVLTDPYRLHAHECDDPEHCAWSAMLRYCQECWIDILEGPCRIRIRGERGYLWTDA